MSNKSKKVVGTNPKTSSSDNSYDDLISNALNIIEQHNDSRDNSRDNSRDEDTDKKISPVEEDFNTLNTEALKHKNYRYSQDTDNRKYLAWWSAITVSMYLYLVFIVLFFNTGAFRLNDSVIITLLGTTTINVLTLMFIVLRGYFDNKVHKDS